MKIGFVTMLITVSSVVLIGMDMYYIDKFFDSDALNDDSSISDDIDHSRSSG